jgi:ABC-type sugar transport system ATPase subunit
MTTLRVSPPNCGEIVGNLSGGNQQKVLLAKWLATDPEFLILDEPTRGVDIGAKAVIHEAICNMADGGKAVMVISSDLFELMALCDRVLVMKDGRIRADLPRHAVTERSLLLAANGVEESA